MMGSCLECNARCGTWIAVPCLAQLLPQLIVNFITIDVLIEHSGENIAVHTKDFKKLLYYFNKYHPKIKVVYEQHLLCQN